jgi:anti-sigma28 factor (negative regulator of flagellin synthesis)
MKIDNAYSIGRTNAAGLGSRERTVDSSRGTASSDVDKVTLSSASRTVRDAVDVQSYHQERADKVAAIKKMVDSGTYLQQRGSSVIARKVADELDSEVQIERSIPVQSES